MESLRFTATNCVIKIEFLNFAFSMHTHTPMSQYRVLRYVIRIQVIRTKDPTYVHWSRILYGCRLSSTAVVPKTAPCEDLPENPRMYYLMTHFNFTEFSNILKLCRKQKQVIIKIGRAKSNKTVDILLLRSCIHIAILGTTTCFGLSPGHHQVDHMTAWKKAETSSCS